MFSLAAASMASPVYEHVEIAAEPYIHEEIAAEPYVHEEPAISNLALGVVRPGAQQPAPAQQQYYQQPAPAQQQYYQPAQQQQQYYQPAPVQQAAFAAGPWAGTCYNNLGQGVECRRKF